MRLFKLTGFATLLASASLVHAETLTLDAAITRARQQSPEVQLAQRLVEEAEASRVGVGVPLTNPRLFADYRPMLVELPNQPTDPRNGYNVGVDGQFEVSGAGFSRQTEATKRVEVARAELDWERDRAAARAWVAYVDALLASQRVTRVEESLTLQKRVAEAAQKRVTEGVAGEPELTTVLVEVASVERDLSEAQRRLSSARLELASTLDTEPDVTWELTDTGLNPPTAPSEAELVARALERRPELKVVKARLALLEATDERLGREAFPRLGFNLGVDAAPASPTFGFAGLSFEIPVAQRNQGQRAVARAQRETEKARLQSQLRRVAREVALARHSYEARRQQVMLLTEHALPQARRTQSLIEEGWRAGRFDVFRLTTAARDTLRLEREHLETLSAAWADWVELQRTSGGLNP